MAVSIDREIDYLQKVPQIGRYLVLALRRLQDGINNGFQNIAVSPTGKLQAPPPIDALNIKASGGLIHATIIDNSQMQRGKQYFLEYDTSSAFSQPHVVDLGASRGHTVSLPGFDDDGNPQTFFFRAYAQYHGSNPSLKVHFGTTVPTGVRPGGAVMMTLLPSTGSGTAIANGQQGGQGLGMVLFRPASRPP